MRLFSVPTLASFITKALVFSLFITFSTPILRAQTFHKDYYDGKLYLKVPVENPPLRLPLFNETETADGLRKLPAALRDVFAQYGVKSCKKAAVVDDSPILNAYYEIHFTQFAQTAELMAKLSATPYFEKVEKVAIMRKFSVPNDYNPQQLWHIARTGGLDGWDYLEQNFPNRERVVVAIVDDGLYRNHEDLEANIYVNPNEIPNNNKDDDLNGKIDDVRGWDFGDNDAETNPPSGQSHGTHCAGIAGAVTNNNKGIAAISNNNVWLLGVKASSNQSNGQEITFGYQGIQYAAKTGAKVISCSWGGLGNSSFDQESVTYAISKGAIVIVAAGNDNADTGGAATFFPCANFGTLCIGASNGSDGKASYSNYGKHVDIMAPGDLYSTIYYGANGQYTVFNGTSMATPFVAGVAGAMYAAYPNLTPAEAALILKCGCDDIDFLSADYAGKLGAGRINLRRVFSCFDTRECGATEELAGQISSNEQLVEVPNFGFAAGNNSNSDGGYAQLFTGYKGVDRVQQIAFHFGAATPGSPSSVSFRIWRADENNKPSTTVASVNVPMSQIANDVAAGQPTIITFDEPIDVGYKFFAGYQYGSTAETLALKSSAIDQTPLAERAFVKKGSAWNSILGLRGYDLGLAIYPTLTNANPNDEWINLSYTGETVTGKPVTLNSGLVNFDNVLFSWDAGNGAAPSIARKPKITYQLPGVYTVKFTMRRGLCTQTDSIQITITGDSIISNRPDEALVFQNLNLYPNPSNGKITIELPNEMPANQPLRITATNTLGQSVWTTQTVKTAATTAFDFSELPAGIYTLKLQAGTQTFAAKFVLTH